MNTLGYFKKVSYAFDIQNYLSIYEFIYVYNYKVFVKKFYILLFYIWPETDFVEKSTTRSNYD